MSKCKYIEISLKMLRKWPSKRTIRLLTALFLGLLLFSFFMFKVNLSDRIDVLYSSDEWDYQSIAVNFAKGYGFHVTGAFEPIETYKFGQIDKNVLPRLDLFMGIVNIHRPPLYPLFIGLVYKVAGIHPKIIVLIQLLLLVIVAACLPLLGYTLWQNKGYYAGIISAFIFMFSQYKMAEVFLPGQSFTVFFVFLFVWCVNLYENNPTLWRASYMAVVLAVSLLFHGTMILVPGFLTIWIIIMVIRKRQGYYLKHLIVMGAIGLVVLLPWHLFAFTTLHTLKKEAQLILDYTLQKNPTEKEMHVFINAHTPEFGNKLNPQKQFTQSEITLLSDSLLPTAHFNGTLFTNVNESNIPFFKIALLQEIIDAPSVFLIFLSITKNMALDCHNEYIKDGYSNAQWRTDSKSFYNNDGKNGKYSFVRVFNFYKKHPLLFPSLILLKLKAAINYSYFLKFFFLFFTLSALLQLTKKKLWAYVFPGSVLLFLFAFTFNSVYFWAFFLTFFVAGLFYSRCISLKFKVPTGFNFVFFNLIIFSLLAFGNQRYFEVLDVLFVMLCVNIILSHLSEIYKMLGINTLFNTSK